MLSTHIYFNGQCKEAIELYREAFSASVKTIIEDTERSSHVIHSEILIHDQLLMMNDFDDNNGFSKSGGYQLAVRFKDEEELRAAYSVMKEGSATISPMQATDYSDCVVRFIDKFDVRWGFWI